MEIFTPAFNRDSVLELVRDQGYAFLNVASETLLAGLEREMDGLPLEVGDHVTYPINAGKSNEVRQLHARAYRMIDDVDVPFAAQVCRGLADVLSSSEIFPELKDWMPNEIGYQLYRGKTDWISPHRDRRTDLMFSVTFTIAGSAPISIHTSEVDPPDYRHLRQIDEYISVPGTVLFLRAPGFGSGEQVIHEVMPPTSDYRKIVNLRARPTLLPAPSERERI